jgi:ATP-dependent protease HslVU (ClpYQ) peptidase subunit
MTVIVYRDGVMAADSLTSEGGLRCWAVDKIFRGKGGGEGIALIGIAGSLSNSAAVREWCESGCEADQKPSLSEDVEVLQVYPCGSAYWAGRLLARVPIAGDYFAIGSGSQVAMGALEMGASAKQAVEIAIKLRGDCGGPVRVLRHI